MSAAKLPVRTESLVLPPIREAAALAIATGFSEDEAAKKTGTASRIIKTWLRTDSTFVRRIREIRGEISQRIVASMVNKMASAVATLDELCRESRNDATRLAAAKLILEFGMKMQENVEVEERITVCEVSQQQDDAGHESQLRVGAKTTRKRKTAIAGKCGQEFPTAESSPHLCSQ